MPADAAPDPGASGPSTKSNGAIVLAVAVVLIAGGVIFWALSSGRVGPQAPAGDVAADTTGPAADAGAAAPRAADSSAERRAWDASVAGSAKQPAPPPAPIAAPAPVDARLSSALEDVVSRAMPAVVLVESSSGTGSGFFVRRDTVLTNVHVVKTDTSVTLRRMDGSTVPARVDSRSPAYDIAVLKVSTPSVNQAVIPLGSARTLRPGQEVFTIGSALGLLQNSVTRGIVSGVRQSGTVTLVQTDAAANPGNSGGPLLDRTGTAIGITTLGYKDRQGLNFAVAIDHARDILDGRQVTPPAGSLTLENLRSPSAATQSESDRLQQDGGRALARALDALARGADELDPAWRRFRGSCYSSPIVGSFDREWFAVLAPRAMPSPVPAHCLDFFSSFKGEADRFSRTMRTALEEARRAGVLPGDVRDALQSRRLQFDGWDR